MKAKFRVFECPGLLEREEDGLGAKRAAALTSDGSRQCGRGRALREVVIGEMVIGWEEARGRERER